MASGGLESKFVSILAPVVKAISAGYTIFWAYYALVHPDLDVEHTYLTLSQLILGGLGYATSSSLENRLLQGRIDQLENGLAFFVYKQYTSSNPFARTENKYKPPKH